VPPVDEELAWEPPEPPLPELPPPVVVPPHDATIRANVTVEKKISAIRMVASPPPGVEHTPAATPSRGHAR
jgi:hypothetical protein